MKIKIDNYSFNKTAKTVTFTDYAAIRLDSLLLITNATDGIIIFNFADPLKGGTVTNNVLTLTYDTSAMDNSDKLLIYYDDTADEVALASKQDDIATEISNKDIMLALKSLILAVANPSYVDKSANQLRAQVTGSVAVSSCTMASNQDLRTITTVSNLTNMGQFPADHLQRQDNYTAWAMVVRNKIT